MIAGIYVITDHTTGEQYVGMSCDIALRWKQHQYRLRTHRHANKKLQEAWDRDGSEAFTWEILEDIGEYDRHVLMKAESRWFALLEPVFCRGE